ncbi:uncharacterized protein LOC121370560 [Gigantopelta aegis]|uniref:uncharacterized protein LOC121370560 n=1 Tax=Gigantopelta aegis TaxID=1735272 RepID=UPI001B88C068|nr:uncharacterized protein LOC121370560 [Gigantopelta aegis]
MKTGIVIAVAFLLQVSTAVFMKEDSLEDLDGHKYDFITIRNGEEIISRDGKLNEIAVPLKEHGVWIVIKEDDKNICYVVDMTKEEQHDRPSDGKSKLLHYEVKAVKEFHPDIKRTCEEYGGEGRTIVQLGPKDDSNPFFRGKHPNRKHIPEYPS